jgi:hypothetical protein
MGFRICGKKAVTLFTRDMDRKDVPLCAEHEKATIALQESLGHECKFIDLPDDAQPIDKMCQFKLDRQSPEDAKEFKAKKGITDNITEK